jgi:hypothetical protein
MQLKPSIIKLTRRTLQLTNPITMRDPDNKPHEQDTKTSTALIVLIGLSIVGSLSGSGWPKSYVPGWERRDFIYHLLPNGCFRVKVVEVDGSSSSNGSASAPSARPDIPPLSDDELSYLVDLFLRESGLYDDVRDLIRSYRCAVSWFPSVGSRVYYVVTVAFHMLPGQAEGVSKGSPKPFWVEWEGSVEGLKVRFRGYAVSVTFEAYKDEGGVWRIHKWYPNVDVALPLPEASTKPDVANEAAKAVRIARDWLKSKGVEGAIVRFTGLIEKFDDEGGLVHKEARVVAVDCRGKDDWTLWRIKVDLLEETVVEDWSSPVLYWGPPWRCPG